LKTDIQDRAVFTYNPKRMVDSYFNRISNPPNLHGMSGGPALEVRAMLMSEDEIKLHVRLAGVLVEWHQKQKVVVAAETHSLLRLLEAVAPPACGA